MYDPSTDHEPLFTLTQSSGPGATEQGRRPKSVPSVAHGKCPDCANTNPVGLVKQGGHLAWRLHTRRTLSGATLECRASGVPLCSAAAKPEPGLVTPTCSCGGAA